MPSVSYRQRAVMGVDAAWTEHGSSGVALAILNGGRWKVVNVAPSYHSFVHDSPGKADWGAGQKGETPHVKKLLERAKELAGVEPCVVSLDMPITCYGRVIGRREADNAVSREFGRYSCAVHSPTGERPGAMGEDLCSGFEAHGYHVAVLGDTPTGLDLVEVYPHATLVRLTGAAERLPYKVAKTKKYWPDHSLSTRAQRLLAMFQYILSAIREEMDVPPEIFALPQEARLPLSGLKPIEDGLDALVCVLAGISFVEGKASAFGDATGAIWI